MYRWITRDQTADYLNKYDYMVKTLWGSRDHSKHPYRGAYALSMYAANLGL